MHRRPQDYEFFKRLNPTVMKVMDGGPPDYQWIRENLPNALVVARIHALSEQHGDLLKDPIGTGKRHATEWDRHANELGFDRSRTLVLGVNEPHVWEPGVPEALRQYTIALCDEATRLGLRVGAMQLSVGWPNNDGPDTPPNWSAWHGVDNAIRANNGALVVHEYWADNGPGENWGWWAGRVLKCPWQVPIVIGECGIDMYVKDGSVAHLSRGWRGRKSPEQYAGELADYTERMSADGRFVGCAVFAADFANGEWASFDIEPAYQAILATPIDPPHTVHVPAVGTGTQPATMYVAAPDGVNMRSTPLIENDNILAKIPLGTAVDVEGYDTGLKGEPWARVKLPTGGYGYIRMDLLSTAQPPVAQPTPAPDQPQKPPPVTGDNWTRSRAFVKRWEGGFQDFDWDAGNWTGCEVGKGEKKGTNRGISACAYPNLNIREITEAQADDIFFRDYWQRSGADKLEWPMCLLVYNAAVNFHPDTARKWLEQSGGSPLSFVALMLRGYRKSKAWPQAGNAWVDRTIEVAMEASKP